MAGKSEEEAQQERSAESDWRKRAQELAEDMPLKEAARQTSREYNLSRREIYQYLLTLKD